MPALGPPARPLPPLRSADTTRVGTAEHIWRIYRQRGGHPNDWNRFRFYGPLATGRFDPHLPPPTIQDRGALYGSVRRPPRTGAPALHACLAEAFQDTRTIDSRDRDPWIVAFAPTAPLTLLDLASGWTTRVGGHQSLASGPRDVAREWARAIYDDYPHLDGIHYPAANYGPGHNLVLFDRAQALMPANPRFHRPLADPGLRPILDHAADLLGYALV